MLPPTFCHSCKHTTFMQRGLHKKKLRLKMKQRHLLLFFRTALVSRDFHNSFGIQHAIFICEVAHKVYGSQC